MRADRIPLKCGDEVDEFRRLPWWFISNNYKRDSQHRRNRKATKEAYNRRVRRLENLTCQPPRYED